MRVHVTKRPAGAVIKVPISTEFIKLESFLKLCGAVESGGMAKQFIQNGQVAVAGEVCTMRGRKLRPGDRVTLEGQTWEVTADAP